MRTDQESIVWVNSREYDVDKADSFERRIVELLRNGLHNAPIDDLTQDALRVIVKYAKLINMRDSVLKDYVEDLEYVEHKLKKYDH